MASHTLIEAHLAKLAQRLPGALVDELADGLIETYEQHLARGLSPDAAATIAIAEFIRQAPGRRGALVLLATGPIAAALWAPSLILGHAWTWPIPTPVPIGFGLTLLAVVGILIAATSRHRYPRTRLAGVGALGLIVLDTAALSAVLLAAPTLVWPMALAIPASLTRIGLTARALPHLLAR